MKNLNEIKSKLIAKGISFESDDQYFFCASENFLYTIDTWCLYNQNYSINDAINDKYVQPFVPKFDIK